MEKKSKKLNANYPTWTLRELLVEDSSLLVLRYRSIQSYVEINDIVEAADHDDVPGSRNRKHSIHRIVRITFVPRLFTNHQKSFFSVNVLVFIYIFFFFSSFVNRASLSSLDWSSMMLKATVTFTIFRKLRSFTQFIDTRTF